MYTLMNLQKANMAAPLTSQRNDSREIASAYWNQYYSQAAEIKSYTQPSNFCRHCVANVFLSGSGRVIDLGCGNGRDSIYLAQNGFSVTAIDQSAAALMLLTQHARDMNVGVETHQGDFPGFYTPVATHAYSRFSLHAIDNEDQNALFRNVRKMIHSDHVFAIEARTTQDIEPNASTHVESWDGIHYRRYLHVPSLVSELALAKFDIQSIIQGRDLAPLTGVENPHVVRIVAS